MRRYAAPQTGTPGSLPQALAIAAMPSILLLMAIMYRTFSTEGLNPATRLNSVRSSVYFEALKLWVYLLHEFMG